MIVGGSLCCAIVLIALLAPLLAPHDPYAQDLANGASRRSGTTQGSGCTRSAPTSSAATTCRALIYGARISLLIGLAVMVISGLIGTTIGAARRLLRRPGRPRGDLPRHHAPRRCR